MYPHLHPDGTTNNQTHQQARQNQNNNNNNNNNKRRANKLLHKEYNRSIQLEKRIIFPFVPVVVVVVDLCG